MMISLKIIAAVLVILIIAGLAFLSFTTRHNVLKDPDNRNLTSCPDTPNCVSSIAAQADHKVEPFFISESSSSQSWDRLINILKQQGAEILVNDGNYCHAVFSSTIFRYKDDLELKRDNRKINIRSASRAGSSDMGVNRKRVEKIRKIYLEQEK